MQHRRVHHRPYGQHDTGYINAFTEAFSDIYGVLPRERVDHEQDFLRNGDLCHRLHFVHQLLVNMQAASGVEDQDIKALQLCSLHGTLCNVDRLLPLHNRKRRNLCLRAKRRQLLLCGRTIDVQRSHQDFLALLGL